MKKILIFIDCFTPAVKAGGPISSVENMVNLLPKEFEFYIITSAKDLNSKQNLEGVVLNNWRKVGSANVIYLEKSHLKNNILKSLVAEINPSKIKGWTLHKNKTSNLIVVKGHVKFVCPPP